MGKRRQRSEMKRRDCLKALAEFAPKVSRIVHSSDGNVFTGSHVKDGFVEHGYINVSFLVRGSFGVADDLLEAIRILAGHTIAADDKRPRRKP